MFSGELGQFRSCLRLQLSRSGTTRTLDCLAASVGAKHFDWLLLRLKVATTRSLAARSGCQLAGRLRLLLLEHAARGGWPQLQSALPVAAAAVADSRFRTSEQCINAIRIELFE